MFVVSKLSDRALLQVFSSLSWEALLAAGALTSSVQVKHKSQPFEVSEAEAVLEIRSQTLVLGKPARVEFCLSAGNLHE
jgi:hypothetical protein